jgi:hypothetical protein
MKVGCNCNKDKQNQQKEFRKQELPEEKSITEKVSMIQNFATAIVSRGLNNNKVSLPVKQLRVMSCFGNIKHGGELPPCEHLKPSVTPGKFYCGGCGCGDKKGTWLIADGEEYSKLDYPKLACPLQMPGFSNYTKSSPDEGEEPVTRRYYIENNITYKDLQKIPVTTPELKNK